ncbi:MAG: Spy/CpxP family protein refolding chaperone [Methylocystis sp.]|jgi:hypothetical protein
MRKRFLMAAATAVFLIPSLSCAIAAGPEQPQGEHYRVSEEDRAAFTDARIAALKAGLKLTQAQEKNWPTLETAIREEAKARAARVAEWREKSKDHDGQHNAIDALQARAKGLEARAAELVKLASAAKPLYDSLDDGQKHRFGVLLHTLGGRGHGGHWGHRDGWSK